MDLSGLLDPIVRELGLPAPPAGAPLRIGVGDSAKAAAIAALARDCRGPMVVVVAKPSRAGDLAEELSAWLGDANVGRVRLYPQRDALPYERGIEDPWDARARLEAIAALAGDERPVIVAAVEAVAQRTISRERARGAVWSLSLGDRLSPEDLLRRLLDSGFDTVPLVEAPGQAARRGGIIDVFPPQAEAPARVEFLGDAVESIRAFDPSTQRSQGRMSDLRVGPARDFSPDPALARDLLKGLRFESCQEETARTLREELETIAEGGSPPPRSFLPALLSPHSLLDRLTADATVVLDEPVDLSRALDEYVAETATIRIEREARGDLPIGLPAAQANWSDLQRCLAEASVIEIARFAVEEAGALRPPFAPAPSFGGRVRVLARDLGEATKAGQAVVIVSQQAPRLVALLAEEGVPARLLESLDTRPAAGVVQAVRGSVHQGWLLRGPSTGSGRGREPLLLLSDAEVFGFVKQRRALRAPGPDRSAFIADLSPGDYVVHLEHGIARFAGLTTRSIEGVEREYLQLDYAEGDRLYVPVDQADRVARYVGPGDYRPGLTRLGSGEWVRARERVRRAVADIARELLELYASRQVVEGHAFGRDTPWQQELEASFAYVETPDQIAAITEVKADMETPRPMDRLICGDVGYGKTEVAVRAAFKAVMDGYQVAVLVPTTVLAQQHFVTFRERLASLPARVEMLSRFLSDKEQRNVVRDAAEGGVDILIGTHRMLQKDVGFKKLGLVVIDEEQRFGVGHKERLKEMRREVDVLTLSATPIPRTLHMSLIGIRDMSNMVTPPEDRLPIRTYVLESDDELIREAIVREMERGGQVFFVHNRVYNIEMVAARLRRLVPEAEIDIGHGQMAEEQLERTMLAFTRGEIDVLVCTTIIESGLDIPNANTIIVNNADKLGLAQLYQLRGRVGRGAVRAYAYLLYERAHALSETAQRRLQAVFEATELGAGFQIALHDLEIRGAGNLLGSEQSGHMAAVGFDLYVKLLGEAVERLKALQRGESPPPPASAKPAVTLDLPITAHLPETYIPDLNLRLAVYQRLAGAASAEGADAIERELVDRFGPLPPAARNLLWTVKLRDLAAAAGVGSIQTEDGDSSTGSGQWLVVRLLPGREIDRARLSRQAGIAWVGPHQVRLDREALGAAWRETLVRTLAALSGATTAVGVPSAG